MTKEYFEDGFYEISSGPEPTCKISVEAPNGKTAWRMWWAKVREMGWGHKLGIIATMKAPGWKSEDDTIAMKTYPTLWNMKLVDWDTLVESLALHVYDGDKAEAGKVLAKYAEEDAWAVPAEAVDLEHDWKGRRLN